MTIGGTFLWSNLVNSLWNSHLSKAFVQSSVVNIIGVPCRRYQLDTSITNHEHCVVLVSHLKPNWRESVVNKCDHNNRMVLSNNFSIKLEPAIALYESHLLGSFIPPLNNGKNAHDSNDNVAVP